jgi:hypothetical protein
VPDERVFVWKQAAPFTLQGLDGRLTCGALVQEVQRGVETIGDKRLEFGNPQAIVFFYGDLKASGVSKQYHDGCCDLVAS